MLKVAVKLPAATGRIGDYLAEVTALEAAGADTIWLDARTDASIEPWILLGAIAAVTHRVRLGVRVGSTPEWPATVATLGRLSGGRVVLGWRPRPGDPKGFINELKSQSSAQVPPSILIDCDSRAEAERSAHLADGVIVAVGDEEARTLRAGLAQAGEFELWVDVAIPGDKAGWAGLIAALEAASATGAIVAWEPRIIDLLRSAGEPDDRTDLLIATG